MMDSLRIFTKATFNAMSGVSWLICQQSWTKVEPNAAANQNTPDAFPKHMRRKRVLRSEPRYTLVAWPVMACWCLLPGDYRISQSGQCKLDWPEEANTTSLNLVSYKQTPNLKPRSHSETPLQEATAVCGLRHSKPVNIYRFLLKFRPVFW